MTVTVDDIKKAIATADIIGVDVSKLAADKPLTAQGLDSLDLMAVFLEIEETYGIRVPDEDYDNLHTPEEIRDYLNERLNAANPA